MAKSQSSSSSRSPDAHPCAQPALDAVLREPAGDILRRAMWLEAVDRQLRSALPVSLAGRVRVANLAQGRLSLRVDSAIWHSRARLQQGDIIEAARSVGLDVQTVHIRVAEATAPLYPEPAASPASEDSRAALAEALALLKKP